jgi:hypothetical protein
MAEPRTLRVLVVAPGGRPAAVSDGVTAVAANDGICCDELHVLTSPDSAGRLRAVLLKSGTASAFVERCRRLGVAKAHILFGRRTIHTLGSSGTPDSIADDALNMLRKLCADMTSEVTVVAASDAGVLGIVAHSALQLVGRPRDRFFVLEARRLATAGATPGRRRKRPPSLPALVEVPTMLADRPVSPSQSYNELVVARRLARRRQSEPGILVLDGRRRSLALDGVELYLPRLQLFWMFCLASLAPMTLPLRVLSANVDVDADGRIDVASAHPQPASLEALVRHIKQIFVSLFPEAAEDFPSVYTRACGPTPGLPTVIAKINSHLKRVLGGGAEPYLIQGGRGAGGYRLTLPPEHIELVPPIRFVQKQRGGAPPIDALPEQPEV